MRRDFIKQALRQHHLEDRVGARVIPLGFPIRFVFPDQADHEQQPRADLSERIISNLKQRYSLEHKALLDIAVIPSDYSVIVQDESIQNPFIISSELVRIILKHTNQCATKEEKAFAIYQWIEQNIDYGVSKRTNGCKTSKEALADREGVCGEMAFVYIAMSRCCGIRSALVNVDVDMQGKKVNHACAIVDVNGRSILVDPAYHTFDIKHKKWKVLPDSEVLMYFNQWRR